MKKPIRSSGPWSAIFLSSLFCGAILLVPASLGAAQQSDAEVLLRSYLRLMLARQLPLQAVDLVSALAPEDVAQVKAYVSTWAASKMSTIRGELTQHFDQSAQAEFQTFVSDFTSAEKRNDAEYLARLGTDLELASAPPQDYAALKRSFAGEHLGQDIGAESQLLGEIETWADLKTRGVDTPPFHAWIRRGEPIEPLAPDTGGTAQPGDPLMAAEAPLGEYQGAGPDSANPMDAFSSSRKARRQLVLEEAQAGMQQVAAERRAAEEEYAQKKLASAQAEAEAMKRQAEELASVEQQALEQRQKSWGNRIKNLFGTAAGAFGGAFLGGIGAAAGEEAIDAVWPDYR